MNWWQKIALAGYVLTLNWMVARYGLEAALMGILTTICVCVFIGSEKLEEDDQ